MTLSILLTRGPWQGFLNRPDATGSILMRCGWCTGGASLPGEILVAWSPDF